MGVGNSTSGQGGRLPLFLRPLAPRSTGPHVMAHACDYLSRLSTAFTDRFRIDRQFVEGGMATVEQLVVSVSSIVPVRHET